MPSTSIKPEWLRLDLSLGHLISMVVFVGGAVGLFYGLSSRIDDNMISIKTNTTAITSVRISVNSLEDDFETQKDTAQEERVNLTKILTDLSADVRYLRLAVDDLKQRRSTPP